MVYGLSETMVNNPNESSCERDWRTLNDRIAENITVVHGGDEVEVPTQSDSSLEPRHGGSPRKTTLHPRAKTYPGFSCLLGANRGGISGSTSLPHTRRQDDSPRCGEGYQMARQWPRLSWTGDPPSAMLEQNRSRPFHQENA